MSTATRRMLTKNGDIEVLTGEAAEPFPKPAPQATQDVLKDALRRSLQCIRAGVRGYLPRDASAEDVVEAVKSIHAGKAVCPGALCTVLFRYIELEATCFPSASVWASRAASSN